MDPDHAEEEFTLEVDSELRFEIETKNRKVIVEVSTPKLFSSFYLRVRKQKLIIILYLAS